MTDFKVKIGAKETVLDVQVIVLSLLTSSSIPRKDFLIKILF